MKPSRFVLAKVVLIMSVLSTGLLSPAVAVATVITSVQADVAGFVGEEKTGGPVLSVSASSSDASASAALDLFNGTLRADASTTPTGGAHGRAAFTDTITVTGPVSGIIFGTLLMHVTGEIIPDLATSFPVPTIGALFLNSVSVGSQQALTDYFTWSCAGYLGVAVNCHEVTTVDYIARRNFSFSDLDRSITIEASLVAQTSQGGQARFNNTAVLSIELPQGLGFTSESGVLLTQAQSVPEPETWALVAIALVMLGFKARRDMFASH